VSGGDVFDRRKDDSLQELYDTTEERLLYGVGVLAMPNGPPAPFVRLHYRDWPREKLELVRGSLRAGLVLTRSRSRDDTRDLHITTRERITVEVRQDGHTSVLRAPAWTACLAQIDEDVLDRFETGRRRFGGFLLSIRTPRLEFVAAVDDARNRVRVGPLLDSSASGEATN
jgi:hypothetical protein